MGQGESLHSGELGVSDAEGRPLAYPEWSYLNSEELQRQLHAGSVGGGRGSRVESDLRPPTSHTADSTAAAPLEAMTMSTEMAPRSSGTTPRDTGGDADRGPPSLSLSTPERLPWTLDALLEREVSHRSKASLLSMPSSSSTWLPLPFLLLACQ